jgi:hypothetical protein
METNGRAWPVPEQCHRSPLGWGRSAGNHQITDGGLCNRNALIVIRRSLPSDLDSFDQRCCVINSVGSACARLTAGEGRLDEADLPAGCVRAAVGQSCNRREPPRSRVLPHRGTRHEKGPKRRPPRRQLRPSRPLARSPATSGKSLGDISCSVPVVHNRAKCRTSPERMSKLCQGGHDQVTERRWLGQ